jgi:hypothetical protein
MNDSKSNMQLTENNNNEKDESVNTEILRDDSLYQNDEKETLLAREHQNPKVRETNHDGLDAVRDDMIGDEPLTKKDSATTYPSNTL